MAYAELVEMADVDLVRLVKLGNDDALGMLLRRHRDALYRFCAHLMTNRDDAEDVCQESMARAITRVETLQTGAAFRSWLFSSARNLSIDSHRSKKRLCALPDENISPLPLPLQTESPYERVETHEEYRTVAQALGKLKKNHQTVLMLREVEGLSYAEIATRLDVSQAAVETLLFRARRRLREEYGRSAAPAPAFGILGGLRGLLGRFAKPFAGLPAAAKVAAIAALVGTAIVGVPRAVPVLHAAGLPSGPAWLGGSSPALTLPHHAMTPSSASHRATHAVTGGVSRTSRRLAATGLRRAASSADRAAGKRATGGLTGQSGRSDSRSGSRQHVSGQGSVSRRGATSRSAAAATLAGPAKSSHPSGHGATAASAVGGPSAVRSGGSLGDGGSNGSAGRRVAASATRQPHYANTRKLHRGSGSTAINSGKIQGAAASGQVGKVKTVATGVTGKVQGAATKVAGQAPHVVSTVTKALATPIAKVATVVPVKVPTVTPPKIKATPVSAPKVKATPIPTPKIKVTPIPTPKIKVTPIRRRRLKSRRSRHRRESCHIRQRPFRSASSLSWSGPDLGYASSNSSSMPPVIGRNGTAV